MLAKFCLSLSLALCFLPALPNALDNGLGLTPPMGWMTWERFRCNIDCTNDPLNCISEDLMKQQAEQMVLLGLLDVGYEYIIVDDCWLAEERDEDGKLQADPERFPSGIPALADYVHSLGLKFGIYEDFGNYTCAGYPGVLGHLETDANTFAEWGVDYVKLDGCYADPETYDEGYPAFGYFLNQTGRPIMYSCSWPAYLIGQNPPYSEIQEACNLWRNYYDIADSWTSVNSIIQWYGDDDDEFAQYAAPGSWNDPDMIIIGNFGLSYDQARVQMAIWSVLAAPLIMSNDLRDIDSDMLDLLLNTNVIAINQDPIGHQARRVYQDNGVSIFVKNINPVDGDSYSAGVAVMYTGTSGTPVDVTFTPSQLGLDYSGGYITSEVFDGDSLGTFGTDDAITVKVNPTGVQLLRLDLNVGGEKKASDKRLSANDISSADWVGQEHFAGIVVKDAGTSGGEKLKVEL